MVPRYSAHAHSSSLSLLHFWPLCACQGRVVLAGNEALLKPQLYHAAYCAGLQAESDPQQPELRLEYISRLLDLVYMYFFRDKDLVNAANVLSKVGAVLLRQVTLDANHMLTLTTLSMSLSCTNIVQTCAAHLTCSLSLQAISLLQDLLRKLDCAFCPPGMESTRLAATAASFLIELLCMRSLQGSALAVNAPHAFLKNDGTY